MTVASVQNATTGTVWMIDYDIPQKPESRRRQFYRQRAKICAKQHTNVILSTNSVLVCRSLELAKAMYDLASEYGKAHLHRVIDETSSTA